MKVYLATNGPIGDHGFHVYAFRELADRAIELGLADWWEEYEVETELPVKNDDAGA